MIQEKLKNLRKQKGVTQEKMAKIISTDPSNYSRKERGETKIYDEEWEKMAEALNVPIEDIREETSKGFSFQYENSNFHDHSGSNINYYSIPDAVMNNLQDFISFLKEQIQELKEENKELKEENKNLKSQK